MRYAERNSLSWLRRRIIMLPVWDRPPSATCGLGRIESVHSLPRVWVNVVTTPTLSRPRKRVQRGLAPRSVRVPRPFPLETRKARTNRCSKVDFTGKVSPHTTSPRPLTLPREASILRAVVIHDTFDRGLRAMVHEPPTRREWTRPATGHSPQSFTRVVRSFSGTKPITWSRGVSLSIAEHPLTARNRRRMGPPPTFGRNHPPEHEMRPRQQFQHSSKTPPSPRAPLWTSRVGIAKWTTVFETIKGVH